MSDNNTYWTEQKTAYNMETAPDLRSFIIDSLLCIVSRPHKDKTIHC